VLHRVHLLTRLGRLEMVDSRLEAAAAALDEARALLGDGAPAPDADDVTVDRWLELMVDGRAGLESQGGDPELALATLEAVRPVLEARGNPARFTAYYSILTRARAMKNRYRIDETDIANVRRALAAAEEFGDEKDIGYATSFVGRLLLQHDDLAQGRQYLDRSLAIAERIGESILIQDSRITLALIALIALIALRRGDVAAVRALIAVVGHTSASWHHSQRLGCLAWLAWQDGRPTSSR
jgi:ATP/maltotriose-dependent transcriptional regulator MalT